MSNTKPLTAEDIFNDKSRLVKWPYDMDTEFLDKESAVESMQLYSDRQCIAKDAEIEKQVKNMWDIQSRLDEAVDMLKKLKACLGVLRRSMTAHPDCTEDSEFEGFANLAQDHEELADDLLPRLTSQVILDNSPTPMSETSEKCDHKNIKSGFHGMHAYHLCTDCNTDLNAPEPESPWISVQERLPELTEPEYWYNDDNVREVWRQNDHATVLAFCKHRGPFKAQYDERGWSERAKSSIDSTVNPTHWMPLPAPPSLIKCDA